MWNGVIEMGPPEIPAWVYGWLVVIGGIIAALGRGAWIYLQRANRGPEPAKQMVIDRASVADIRPIIDIRDDVRAMRELMEEAAEERKERRRVDLVVERLARMQARRRRRGEDDDDENDNGDDDRRTGPPRRR
ncbi:hypothetical protein AB4037_23535 [Labrys sp. KB_33_2]|uniref:hypothetical protein n=1 Tax=Labrys sp. KB_33_2 TaxID=3237479 RepID=UPI003F8FA06D